MQLIGDVEYEETIRDAFGEPIPESPFRRKPISANLRPRLGLAHCIPMYSHLLPSCYSVDI